MLNAPDTGFRARLAEVAGETEALLDRLLTPAGTAPGEARLMDAMRHGTLGGGKRLRAFLAVEAAGLFDGPGDRFRVAAAAECLHAYSLIHDDLPAMDDDDLRRGKPTVHRAYDDATAILAGDALQTLAFEILADPATHPSGEVRAELALALARAAGAGGMVGGQVIDIAAEAAEAPFDLATITRLQDLKTGALIAFSAESGAILGEAPAEDRAALRAYALKLGLAFQIRDDLLDEEGDEEAAGKRLKKDAEAGKATFVSLLGLEGAKARARELADGAAEDLARFGAASRWLRAAADFAITRQS